MPIPTAPYNLTLIAEQSNSTGLLGMFQQLDVVVFDGWMMTIFLLALYFVFTTSFVFRGQRMAVASVSGSFIVLMIAITLFALNFMNIQGIIIIVAIWIISFVASMFGGS